MVQWELFPDNPDVKVNPWTLSVTTKDYITKDGALIDLPTLKYLQLYLLDLTIADDDTDWVLNTKLYCYFIYSMIKACQAQCLEFFKVLGSDKYLNYIKETIPNWTIQDEAFILDRATKTYVRFLIYESIFKSLFDIPLEEENLDKINARLPYSVNLTDQQITILREQITEPVFYGVFKPVFDKQKYIVSNCSSGTCKIESTYFPYPLDEEFKKPPVYTLSDGLRIAAIYNDIAHQKRIAYSLIYSWAGLFDRMLGKLTGVDKGYIIKLGENTEKLGKTVAGAASNAYKAISTITSGAAGYIYSGYQAAGGFAEFAKPVLILGGLALGLSLVNRVLGD